MNQPRSIISTVRLTTEEHRRMAEFAERRGRAPYGTVLRQALLEFLERNVGQQKSESGGQIVETEAAAF